METVLQIAKHILRWHFDLALDKWVFSAAQMCLWMMCLVGARALGWLCTGASWGRKRGTMLSQVQ